MTPRPKCGRIICPPEIVTLLPQKVGRSVTVEHSIPLVLLAPTVCDTVSPIPPRFSRFLHGPWALSGFYHYFALLKGSCVHLVNFLVIFFDLDMVSHTH